MTAGAGAGLVSSIVTCPLDVVKTRLQAQHLARDASDYEGVRGTVKRIWRQAGFRGFYRGLGPTVAGYLPTWGIYFTVYDLVKDRAGGWAENSGELSLGTSWLFSVATGRERDMRPSPYSHGTYVGAGVEQLADGWRSSGVRHCCAVREVTGWEERLVRGPYEAAAACGSRRRGSN